jgi:hypothetical protein
MHACNMSIALCKMIEDLFHNIIQWVVELDHDSVRIALLEMFHTLTAINELRSLRHKGG